MSIEKAFGSDSHQSRKTCMTVPPVRADAKISTSKSAVGKVDIHD